MPANEKERGRVGSMFFVLTDLIARGTQRNGLLWRIQVSILQATHIYLSTLDPPLFFWSIEFFVLEFSRIREQILIIR